MDPPEDPTEDLLSEVLRMEVGVLATKLSPLPLAAVLLASPLLELLSLMEVEALLLDLQREKESGMPERCL